MIQHPGDRKWVKKKTLTAQDTKNKYCLYQHLSMITLSNLNTFITPECFIEGIKSEQSAAEKDWEGVRIIVQIILQICFACLTRTDSLT